MHAAADPEIFQVKLPVGAASAVLPETTAEKIMVCPTVVAGVALSTIVGVDVPRLMVIVGDTAAV